MTDTNTIIDQLINIDILQQCLLRNLMNPFHYVTNNKRYISIFIVMDKILIMNF